MSHGEAMHEVGRLTAELRSLQAEISDLKHEKEALSRDNDAMSDEMTDVKVKLQRAEREKASLMAELNHVRAEVQERDAAMKKMSDDMAKAQKTIKVQSDQIATPSTSKKPPMTPHHLGPRPDAPNASYTGPPPVYSTQRNAQPFKYSNAPGTFPPPMARQNSAQMQGQDPFQSAPMTRQHSAQTQGQDPFQGVPLSRRSSVQVSAHDPFQSTPMSRQPSTPIPVQGSFHSAPNTRQVSAPLPVQSSFQSAQYQPKNANGRRGFVVPPVPTYDSFGSHQIALVEDEDTETINLIAEHTNLFKKVEIWARNYANVPDQARDYALPKALLANLAELTNPDIVMNLLCTGSTRYFSVAKLMNMTLANIPLRPLVVKGFTPQYDAKISDIRSQLGQHRLPIHVRRALLVASAEVVEEMMHTAAFRRWLEGEIGNQIGRMWNFIEPLFAPGMARNEAWEDLTHIWREAVRIGLLQMKKASSFTLDFPPIGLNSRFNPSNMVNRDAQFKQDAVILGQIGASVRMSITPIVTETNFMTNAVVPKTLHYANVLLQL